MKLNSTNISPLSDSTFNTLLFFVHLTFCIEKITLGSHYDEDWQTNEKYSAVCNGTRHFLSFQSTSIWSTSGVSAVAHCQTRKTRESSHTLGRCQIILHTWNTYSSFSPESVTSLHLDLLYISLLVLVVITDHQLEEGVIPYEGNTTTLPVSNNTQLRGSEFTLQQPFLTILSALLQWFHSRNKQPKMWLFVTVHPGRRNSRVTHRIPESDINLFFLSFQPT
jgi:hypothetical protein